LGLSAGARYRARGFDGRHLKIAAGQVDVAVPEQFRSELVLVERAL
jgi:hypothetical protein